MKRWLFFIWWVISFGAAAQSGDPDMPVFISREIDDVDYGSFSLNTSYYTIANNIDNRQSSAFISDTPSSDEYRYFAQHQPSYYFLIHRKRSVLGMILFHQRTTAHHSGFTYTIVNPATGHRREIPSRLPGALTQHRAQELVANQLVSSASFLNDTLCLLGEIPYPVLALAAVQGEVVAMAQQLLGRQLGKTNELEKYIRAETIGGRLDFDIALAQEPQQRFSRHGINYSKARFSVLLWGGAVRMLGLRSVETARALWEDIQQRPLTQPEWRALRNGFQEQTLAEVRP
ncbi:MAG: hypothetical protein WA960_08255 [Tunicatimonas sp.]